MILSKENLPRKSPLQISTRLANIAYKMLTFLQISLNCTFHWILIEMLQSWLCIGASSTLGMEGKLIIQIQWGQAIPFMNTRWIRMFWSRQYGYKIHRKIKSKLGLWGNRSRRHLDKLYSQIFIEFQPNGIARIFEWVNRYILLNILL